MPSFFALCDVLAVTSLNSTEAFGMVQVEAMLSGTPVVATDLPGVREAVRRTGMGEIVPPRDPAALATALSRSSARPPRLRAPARRGVRRRSTWSARCDEYEDAVRGGERQSSSAEEQTARLGTRPASPCTKSAVFMRAHLWF